MTLGVVFVTDFAASANDERRRHSGGEDECDGDGDVFPCAERCRVSDPLSDDVLPLIYSQTIPSLSASRYHEYSGSCPW